MLKAETQRSSGTTCPAKVGATIEGLVWLFATVQQDINRTSVKWSLIKHHLIVGYFRLIPNIMSSCTASLRLVCNHWVAMIEWLNPMFICSLSSRQLFAQQSCPTSMMQHPVTIPKEVHVLMLSSKLTHIFWCQKHVIQWFNANSITNTSTVTCRSCRNNKDHGIISRRFTTSCCITAFDYFAGCLPPGSRMQVYFSSLNKCIEFFYLVYLFVGPIISMITITGMMRLIVMFVTVRTMLITMLLISCHSGNMW